MAELRSRPDRRHPRWPAAGEPRATIFNDPQYTDRRFNGYDPYVRYIAINTAKMHEPEAAPGHDGRPWTVTAWRTIAGGSFAGDLADGVVKPNIGPSTTSRPGLWTGLLGQNIPETGDPAYAKQLISESGAPMPTITYDYPNTPTHAKEAALVVSSFGKAGITVKPNPIEPGQYYGVILDPKKAAELMWAGWARTG